MIFFFETIPGCSLPITASKKTIKLVDYYAGLGDVMGQSYSIYARTSANHSRYSSVHVTFCGCWKHSLFK